MHEDPELLPFIHYLTEKLLELELDGIIDIVPAFQSVAVYYSPIQYSYNDMLYKLEPYIQNPGKAIERKPTRLTVPVCYDSTVALDIDEVAAQHQLSAEELIHMHSNCIYTVAIMGFLPGFPYLTGLNDIHYKRLSNFRVSSNTQTHVYSHYLTPF
jgi:inhibitor of KinA